VNAGRAVGSARFGVDRTNCLGQHLILSGSFGRWAFPPLIVATSRDAEYPAHRTDRKFGLVRSYEPEDVGGTTLVS
jgi:hypothetical protein